MRHHVYITLLLVAGFLAATLTVPAIGVTQNQQTTPPQTGMPSMPMTMQNCPMQVSGAEISVLDTKEGIALTITTTTGDVAELRRRVEGMAKTHSTEAMHRNMMPFTAAYEEVPNGARITRAPRDPQKLQEFREVVRQHAEQMKNHDCSMMQGMMQGMMGGMKKTEPPPKSNKDDHNAHHPSEEKK